jgi:ornithine cyclodeaminase/alanine dehydrogenase-like protein (mu-crystallin family)
MKVRLLSSQDVAGLLSMPAAIQAMRSAFAALSSGHAVMPMRSRVDFQHGDMHLMPAALDDSDVCVKIVTTYRGNRQLGLPVVQGLLTLFDGETGVPRAVMNCGQLTAIRTGAAGGLAIDLLARPDSRTLGLLGAGVQAVQQANAALCVRDFRQVFVYDRRREAAEHLCLELQKRPDPPEIQILDNADAVAGSVDVLVTATTSDTPTFQGSKVRLGTHINAVGSYRPDVRETDNTLVERAYVVADCRLACKHEAGDLVIPGRDPDAELGEVVNQTAPGRTSAEQITLFKSVGLAVQDAAVANWLLQRAEEENSGTIVEL